jgi:putative intracellular protease/amidase
MRTSIIIPAALLASLAAAGIAIPLSLSANPQTRSGAALARAHHAVRINPYRPRFGRTRPVIAIIGENSGTELTDYVIPYGILARSGAAEVVAVATRPGVLTMRPALHVRPDLTAVEFDRRFPEGADYVIVPAVVKRDDPALLAWITAQGAKGGTIVSICDGGLVVANTGQLDGHRATAHWATRDLRRESYPHVRWVENARYVADGVDEIALALTADAYTRSGRAKAYAVAASPKTVVTRYGLKVIPDRARKSSAVDRTVRVQATGSRPMLDAVLASIASDYGRATAFGVSLDFEYAGFKNQPRGKS